MGKQKVSQAPREVAQSVRPSLVPAQGGRKRQATLRELPSVAKRSKPLASGGRRGPAKNKAKESSPSEGDDQMDHDFKPPAAKRSAGGRANGRGQRKTATAASGKRLSQAPKRV